MASFTAGTTFVDGVANDVTAAKLSALVNNATPTSGLIQDRTAETVVATNDTFLIGDASDSNTLKRMTVANVMKAELTGTINTTAGTITALNSTTGTITTGVIPTLTSITKITSGTGTAAVPAISPTGDANTGVFFPAADTIAFSEGGAEKMRIDASGNVGIGTDSPLTYMQAYSGSANGVVIADSGIPAIILADTASTTYSVISQNGTSLDLFNTANGSTNFYTYGTERVRIDSSGNVGIGDSSPTAKLDVNGSFNATSGTIPTLVATTLITTGTGTAAAPAISPTGDTSTGIFFPTADTIAFAEGGVEAMRIDSSGNVGIGTDSPTFFGSGSKVLDIVALNSSAIRFERTNSTNPTYGYVTAENGAIAIYSETQSPIIFYTHGTERARIGTTGNVSIGTATALSKLHVHGDLTLSNATTATTASTSTITPPETVAGYLTVSINGTSRKIAYYAT